jgi:hypothetical protein
LLAVPNVTAIDWKQADVYGPSLVQKGGMSFTVMRLCRLCNYAHRFTLAVSQKTQKDEEAQNTEAL